MISYLHRNPAVDLCQYDWFLCHSAKNSGHFIRIGAFLNKIEPEMVFILFLKKILCAPYVHLCVYVVYFS